MPRKEEKRAFVFNASYLNVMEEFPENRRGKLAIAIIEYGLSDSFDGNSIMIMALKPEERIALSPIVETMDIQKRRYQNKQMIKGAIRLAKEKMLETVDSTFSKNDTATEKYEMAVRLLAQKLDDVTKHDLTILPQEAELLLPHELRTTFRARYVVATWEEQFRSMIEAWALNHSQECMWVTADTKEQVYKDMLYDFSHNGKLSHSVSGYFKRYKPKDNEPETEKGGVNGTEK